MKSSMIVKTERKRIPISHYYYSTLMCMQACTNTIRLVCRTDNFLEKIIFLFQLKNSKKLLFCQNTMNIIGCLIFHLIYLRVVVVLGASNLYANKPNQKKRIEWWKQTQFWNFCFKLETSVRCTESLWNDF